MSVSLIPRTLLTPLPAGGKDTIPLPLHRQDTVLCARGGPPSWSLLERPGKPVNEMEGRSERGTVRVGLSLARGQPFSPVVRKGQVRVLPAGGAQVVDREPGGAAWEGTGPAVVRSRGQR